MPGDEGILRVTLKNAEPTNTYAYATVIGSTTYTSTDSVGAEFNNIWITKSEDSNGKEVRATLNYENTGYLAPTASFELIFQIIAEDGIKEGLYFPKINIDIETFTDAIFPIPLNVSNATVELIETSVPSKISQSGATQIDFSVVNNRASAVNNIIITPQEHEGITFSPESVFLESLNGDSAEEITFSLNPLSLGFHNVTFNMSFKNGNNIHYEELTTKIEVIDTLDVGSVFTTIPRSITQGKSSRISLEVYNAKTESITGVIVTPITDAIVLPSQYFIGAMDPDDVFSASFDIYTEDLDLGTYDLEFDVSFKQDNEYYQTPSLATQYEVISGQGYSYGANGVTNGDTEQQSGNLMMSCLPILIAIIVLVAIIIIYRWKKGRRAQ